MEVEDHLTVDWRDLPTAEFAFPGPLRDALVAAILSGAKTTTSSLLAEYESEPLPEPGQRAVVIDSNDSPVAVIETVAVRIERLGHVGLKHAIDEGEGFTTVAEWRVAHEEFWDSLRERGALDDPDFRLGDDTEIVLERFVLIERLP